MAATQEYPKHRSHDDVRCPKCGKALTGEPRQYGQLAGASWVKFCGRPCYGAAWYSLDQTPSYAFGGSPFGP